MIIFLGVLGEFLKGSWSIVSGFFEGEDWMGNSIGKLSFS